MSRPMKTFAGNLTFAQNSDTSSSLDTKDRTLVAIRTPSAMTNTTLELQTSEDGSTWFPVYRDDGTKYTFSLSTSEARHINLNLQQTNSCRWVRLKGASQEDSARTLRYHIRIVR